MLEKGKGLLGEEHPNTLTSQANLAFIYQAQNRWEEAEKLLVYVLGKRILVLGEERRDTLASQADLASLLRPQGHTLEAFDQINRSMQNSIHVLGKDHLDKMDRATTLRTWREEVRIDDIGEEQTTATS